MIKQTLLGAIILSGFATVSTAQEAFVTQVGGLTVTTTTPAQINITAANFLPDMPTAPTTASIHAQFRANLLPDLPTSGQFVSTTQTGDNNTAGIMQTGLQAALIQQTGNSNMAMISQSGGTMNRASIIQASSNASAGIMQRGSGNRALIIQN